MGVLIALHFCVLRPDMASYVRQREKRYAIAVATSLRQARIFVEQARSIVEGSPLLSGFVDSVTDDEIVFSNRSVLAAFPCTSRGVRGWSFWKRRCATTRSWAFLSPPGSAQTSRVGQGGSGAQAGDEVVPDVARRLDVRATVQGRVQASLSHSVAGKSDRPVE